MPCKCEYEQKIKDPKGSSILDLKYTPNFYYLLGLLATDGHIEYPRENSNATNSACIIELNEGDRDLINQINNIFGGYVYITFANRKDKTKMFKWYLNNRKLIEYLRSIGFVHNKTHTLDLSKWFDNIKENNKWHFIRGVWDGDGSMGTYKNSGCRITFVSASSIFANMVYDFLNQQNLSACKHIRTNIKHKSTYHIISLCKKKSRVSFINSLYNNAQSGIYLKRKYTKALEIKMLGG
jgi:hypothetical protein